MSIECIIQLFLRSIKSKAVMIKIKSGLLTNAKFFTKLCLSVVFILFLGLSAQAQISATFSPVVQEIEFCATSGTTSQNFTVTGSTSCSVNPNALSYQWFIDDGGTITNLSASGGSGYNSGTAATLTVTSNC